jgi:hypothetical protein
MNLSRKARSFSSRCLWHCSHRVRKNVTVRCPSTHNGIRIAIRVPTASVTKDTLRSTHAAACAVFAKAGRYFRRLDQGCLIKGLARGHAATNSNRYRNVNREVRLGGTTRTPVARGADPRLGSGDAAGARYFRQTSVFALVLRALLRRAGGAVVVPRPVPGAWGRALGVLAGASAGGV